MGPCLKIPLRKIKSTQKNQTQISLVPHSPLRSIYNLCTKEYKERLSVEKYVPSQQLNMYKAYATYKTGHTAVNRINKTSVL